MEKRRALFPDGTTAASRYCSALEIANLKLEQQIQAARIDLEVAKAEVQEHWRVLGNWPWTIKPTPTVR